MERQGKGWFQPVVREHLRDVKGRLLAAAICTLLLAGADLLRPWPLKIIFDYILFNKRLPHSLSFLRGVILNGQLRAIVIISSCIIAVALIKSFAAYSQTHIVSQIGFRFAHSLRRTLFVHLQRLSLSFHARMRSGELLTNITSDTNDLRDADPGWNAGDHGVRELETKPDRHGNFSRAGLAFRITVSQDQGLCPAATQSGRRNRIQGQRSFVVNAYRAGVWPRNLRKRAL